MRSLLIGNKSFSSWSLRPWIGLKAAGIPFEEKRVLLGQPGTAADLAAHSPTGRVPVLIENDLVIPESLAILEYAADLAPEAGLLPADRRLRAEVRAAATEMHAGFAALRQFCPMNLRRHRRSRKSPMPDSVRKDCARIEALWTQCRSRHGVGGPYLFGGFTIADAMFAPVATRFMSYDLPRQAVADAYIEAIYAHPAFREWQADAAQETESYTDSEGLD